MSASLVDHHTLEWDSLKAYLGRRDAHFATHWEWITKIRDTLNSGTSLNHDAAQTSAKDAERIERLRYQLLHERGENLDAADLQAAEMLDSLFAALTHRGTTSPRHLRRILGDSAFAQDAIAKLEWCLDPQVPLEQVVASARRVTRESFPPSAGQSEQVSLAPWPIFLYAPLYLSSFCVNHCLYCGFRFPEAIPRRILSSDEAVKQVGLLVERGMRHILLVAGDYPQKTPIDYYVETITAIRNHWPVTLAIEIAPQSTAGYARLVQAGIIGVTLYQETYNEQLYRGYHPLGPKSHYDWRLEGLDRAAEAGVERLGLGILLGLADPVADARAMVRHGYYLKMRFPNRRIAFSLPRIHAGPEGFRIPCPVDDETLIRLYCGLRHAMKDAELVLSTREPCQLRDLLAGTCITQLSAGSSTVPGGYGESATHFGDEHDGQFPVVDRRPVNEVITMLAAQGHTIVWQPLNHPTGRAVSYTK
ncbi:MAG: radical SAM protein [Thermogutta sp.]